MFSERIWELREKANMPLQKRTELLDLDPLHLARLNEMNKSK